MSAFLPLSVVHPSEFDAGTAQTPGSSRLAAVTHNRGIDTGLWGGTFVVEPGAHTGIHHHGEQETIVYVLEGEIRSKVGDGPEKTYSTGQMFLETPGQLHGVSGNASDTKPAKFLALLLAKKGVPLTTPA